jgi:hypothetical protein
MKILALIICVLLVMPAAIMAAEGDLSVLEKPVSLTVRSDEYNNLYLRLTLPDSIMELIEDENDFYNILSEVDWKINDAPWKFDSNWGSFYEQGLVDYYYTVFKSFHVANELNAESRSILSEKIP